MKRLNSENMLKQFISIVKRFPVSFFLILLLFYWNFIRVGNPFETSPIETVYTTGILLATVSQLVYERFFQPKEKEGIRWLLYAGVLLFLVLYQFYFSRTAHLIDDAWTIYSIPGIRAMIVYFLSVLLLTWIPSIKSRIKFSDSFLVVFKGYFTSSFFALVLLIGLMLTFFLFEFLFFSLEMDWFSYSYIFSFNLFSPLFFLTFIPDYHQVYPAEEGIKSVEEAANKPNLLRILISYILIPIMAVYTLLLTLYILTNLTTVFFEDNLLEALILTYAINGWTLLILADSIENPAAVLFKRAFPFLLIFVFIFQIISTFMEIQEVGITHGRYLILLFGIGSILSALWYIVKEPRLHLLPIVSLVAGLIAVIPPMDAVGVSVRNQVSRIENLLEEHNILTNQEEFRPNPDVPDADREQITASIAYLRSINALNQLEWYPDDEYITPAELFGFDERREPFEEEVPEENQYYTISLNERTNYSLPVARHDYMLHLVLEKNDTTTEFVMLDDEMYRLDFNLEEGFILTLTPESEGGQETVFDFSSIFESFEKEDAYLPLEQLRFIEESGEHTATLYIQSLDFYPNGYTIEFMLFL